MSRIEVFSSVKEMFEWDKNCLKCKKLQNDVHPITSSCDIWNALKKAYESDGKVEEEIAKRMGYYEHKWNMICPEIDERK
jgi:hypothetical protein